MANLDEIMSGRENTSEQTETPAQVTEQAPPREDGRDEQGRFAPKEQQQPTEQAATPPETQEQRPPDGFIPIQALDARLAKQQERFEAQLREREQAWQRQLEAFRAPQKPAEPVNPPDFYENPDAAVDFRLKQALDPLQNSQQAVVENFSRMMASDKFGEEAVNAAYAELENRVRSNPKSMQFDYQRIMSSPHPYGELVKWHKAQSALSTYGDDPTAYREKLRAEIMAELQGGAQQQQAPAQAAPVMPTSFAGARNAGPSATPAFSGPRPLSEIMQR
jgi:hypothetical protein